MMNLPKPPALLQDLVLLENGDLRHKQREHVSNRYHVCSAKQIAKKRKGKKECSYLFIFFGLLLLAAALPTMVFE